MSHNHSCWQDWLETKRKRRSISGLLRCFLSVSFFITASILSEDQWCLVASMPLSGTIGFPRSICRGLGGPKWAANSETMCYSGKKGRFSYDSSSSIFRTFSFRHGDWLEALQRWDKLFSSISHLIPIGTCLQNAQLTKVLLRRHQMLPPLLERVITSHGPPKPDRTQVRGARLQNCVGCWKVYVP